MCPPCVCPDPPPVSGGDAGALASSVVSSSVLEIYLGRVVVGGVDVASWWSMPDITLVQAVPYAGVRVDTAEVVWGGLTVPSGSYPGGVLALSECPAALGAGWSNVSQILIPDTSGIVLSGGMIIIPSLSVQLV